MNDEIAKIAAKLLEGYNEAGTPNSKIQPQSLMPWPYEVWDEAKWSNRAFGAGYRISAKLNRQRTHIVCGMRDCGSRFAVVERDLDLMVMAEGYAPDSRSHGVWKYSQRTLAREGLGFTSRFRRYPLNGGVSPNSVMSEDETPLPIAVRCVKCGMGNIVASDRVKVSRVRVVLSEG